jgi:hypothetical protein
METVETVQWNYEGSTVPEPFLRVKSPYGGRGAIICPSCNKPNGSLYNLKCYDCSPLFKKD